MKAVPLDLQIDIQQFLNREAAILEANRFRDWLDLFTDDTSYHMPVRQSVEPREGQNDGDPSGEAFALFDDDKSSLTMRTMRLATGSAHAEIPASVTQRLITNVMVEETDHADEYAVSSKFIVYQERHGRYGYTFIGKRDDRLRRVNGGWKIARREVVLAHTILPTTISIFF